MPPPKPSLASYPPPNLPEPEEDDAPDDGLDPTICPPKILVYRRQILALLLHGPRRVGEIAQELTIPNTSLFHAVRCAWFQKIGQGQYRITAAGRTAATGKVATP